MLRSVRPLQQSSLLSLTFFRTNLNYSPGKCNLVVMSWLFKKSDNSAKYEILDCIRAGAVILFSTTVELFREQTIINDILKFWYIRRPKVR